MKKKELVKLLLGYADAERVTAGKVDTETVREMCKARARTFEFCADLVQEYL